MYYIVNNTGLKTSVFHKKPNILSSIKKGLDEVKQIKKTGRKLQTLKDFLK